MKAIFVVILFSILAVSFADISSSIPTTEIKSFKLTSDEEISLLKLKILNRYIHYH